MKDEFTDRHQAIKLRLAGTPIADICHIVGRSADWFHGPSEGHFRWWRRYRADGPSEGHLGVSGLYDNTHVSSQPRRISADLERTMASRTATFVNIRQRLESPRYANTRYGLIGARDTPSRGCAIQAELQALHIHPLPSPRTIERVLTRNGLSLPKVKLSRYVSSHTYPTPQADETNDLHQIDVVSGRSRGHGPIHLKGKRTPCWGQARYYILVCRDVFESGPSRGHGAVCLRLTRSRRMDDVLLFLAECWKSLGRPTRLQLDNGREPCGPNGLFAGWGPSAKHLTRVIRTCLRFGVEPVFIPPAQPQRNGGMAPKRATFEHFNGWFQPRLLQRRFASAAALGRELLRLQDVVNTTHPQRRLGGLTPTQ